MLKLFIIFFSFVCISSFAQPVLLAPPNGVTGYTHMQLVWSKVPSADMYEYQVSSDINFSHTDEDLETLDTFRTVLTPLVPNMSYYWRVRAHVNGSYGSYSSVRAFNVIPSNIIPPALVSPANGSSGVLSTPLLKWNTVPEREQYAVVVATDINFTNVIYGRCIDTTFYEMPPDTLHLGGQYYWAVCSQDSLGFGVFSAKWSFVVRTTGVENISKGIPSQYKLYNNYPNPFNPITKIKFDLPKNSFVKINVLDITGKVVSEILNANLSAGSYETEFNGANLSSGIYYYRLETNDFVETKKMILVK
ncbi:MAG: T9SS type A sorting domain-containing protein [Bacteroidetes bacterium]|nr:T9SS type A sorting domain-containing protein [Bacteroidota bacterium]